MIASVLVPTTAVDGAASSVEVFAVEDARATVIVVPAMGVPARFYRRLATPLADRRLSLAIAEPRGHGRSEIRPSRGVDFGFAALVERDLAVTVDTISDRHPDDPVILLGHSLGGQLSALYAATHPDRVAAFVGVAACSVYWHAFPRFQRLPLLAATQLVSLVGWGWGSYPGHRLGFAGHEARGVMRDWARQSRSGRYLPRDTDTNYEAALAGCTTPGLLMSLEGDTWAPPTAVDHLADKLPGSTHHRQVRDPILAAQTRTHFDWIRHPDPVLDTMVSWLDPVLSAA